MKRGIHPGGKKTGNDRSRTGNKDSRREPSKSERRPYGKSDRRTDSGGKEERTPYRSERRRPEERDDKRRPGPRGPRPSGQRRDEDRPYNSEDRRRKPFAERGERKTYRRKDEVTDRPAGKKQAEQPKMPLNKYVAHCGVASRREAAELIKYGKIKVNGKVVTEPGYKVQEGDKVNFGAKRITPQKNLVYVLLNKPKDYLTTTDDPQKRKTVMELVKGVEDVRLYPVGRLDRNTTGLLLLTNDGELAQKLSHPKYNIKKVYQVTLDKPLTKEHFEEIMKGLKLEDGSVKVDAMSYLAAKNELGLEIHSGRNRIVRRIFEHLGYNVDKLDRVMYAGLTKKNIPRGKWRMLSEKEVILLKHFKS